MRLNLCLKIYCAACVAAAIGFQAGATDSHELRYDRDVRPILSENCFRCHGPDPKNRKAKMRLDERDSAVAKEAFIAGKPDESEMIRRITTTNLDDVMPPPEMHKVVTLAQIEMLKRWIGEGAKYEPHWSYAPVVRPEIPAVKNTAWVQTPVDNFILVRLEAENISPSPAADKRTLVRRLSLDLIGLPPTVAESDAFETNSARDATTKAIEWLLASPHYGERMAVPWLDAVRFADTVGYHGDQNQNVFPFRDYVINSFNDNKPFDRFTEEQLAGDLLPGATDEQKTASGFNRLNMMTREGGAQPKEYLAKYRADRVRTVSTAWLGSTMACCECHDHKYDPFTAKDFYSLGAFFDDIKQWGVYSDYDFTPNPDLKDFSDDHPFPVEIFVKSPWLASRQKTFAKQLVSLCIKATAQIATNEMQRTEFHSWYADIRTFLRANPDGWQTPLPLPVRADKPNHTNWPPSTNIIIAADGGASFIGNTTNGLQRALLLPGLTGCVAAVRITALPGVPVFQKIPAFQHHKGIQPEFILKKADGDTRSLNVWQSEADLKEAHYDNGSEVIGLKKGWLVSTAATNRLQISVWLLDPPVTLAPGDALVVAPGGDVLMSLRVSVSPLAATAPLRVADAEQMSLFKARKGSLEKMALTYLLSTAFDKNDFAECKKLQTKISECRDGMTPTLVTVATTNRLVTRVLTRGNWQDDSGEILSPAMPHFLPQPAHDGTNLLTRRDLAHWLTSRENPLTARAQMNRLWKQFFGTGLSAQPEELGAQGEYPSHLELLNWLADEFMASGWDTKHMVRLIVNSAAYQQDSKGRPELAILDPRNRLLARQNPRRLDAEFVRDNALAIAGLLADEETGGPSVFPYQPDGYYANLQFPDRKYEASVDADQYRRGIYMHWQRAFLHPMLANFDAPAREECSVARAESSTPQQALTLLNDPTFVEAARGFAERIQRESLANNDAAKINFAVQTALLRDAKAEEITSLENFLAVQRNYYATNAAEAGKLLRVGNLPPAKDLLPAESAAWTEVARVILNLHETITRY